jgi:hypothetical protein
MAYRYICMEAEIVSIVTRKQLYGIQLCAELKPPPYIIKDVHTQLLPYYTKKRMMRPYSAVHNSVIRCALVPVNRIKATSIHNKGRPYTIITVLYKKKDDASLPSSAVHNSVIRCALVPVNHVEPLLPRITEWQVSKWIVWPDSNRAFVARIYEDKS